MFHFDRLYLLCQHSIIINYVIIIIIQSNLTILLAI